MSSEPLDPWEILGITPDADVHTIRAAWRDAARTHHPDAGGDAEAFKLAQWAFAQLAEHGSSRRVRHDNVQPETSKRTVVHDGEIGERIMVEVMVDHAVAVFGGSTTVTRWRLVHCPACDGAGDQCPTCRGDGRSGRYHTLAIDVPHRSIHGDVITIAGAGDAGKRRRNANGRPISHTGPYGRLDVRILVDHDRRFIESGDDLIVDAEVSMYDAALGGVITVAGLDGLHPCTIPPGTQSGERLRVPGRGRPRLEGGRGDLVVVAVVVIPRHLDDAARAALNTLRAQGK